MKANTMQSGAYDHFQYRLERLAVQVSHLQSLTHDNQDVVTYDDLRSVLESYNQFKAIVDDFEKRLEVKQ